jgi:hypothetical protein
MPVICLRKVFSPTEVNTQSIDVRHNTDIATIVKKGSLFPTCPKKKKSTEGAESNQYRNRYGGRSNRSSTQGQSNQGVKQVQTGDEIDDLVYTFQ